MTDEERELYQEAIHEVWAEWDSAGKITPNSPTAFEKDVAKKLEAKLSPKSPPQGQPCEVWDNPDDVFPSIRYADGGGEFVEFISARMHETWSHYRVIPTAQDAVELLHSQGLNVAADIVRAHLIYNAQEG